MAFQRAPKQWCLTTTETITSYECWRQNLLYTLSLDKNFAPFLEDGYKWQKKTSSNTYRGFTDDDTSIPESSRRTRIQKTTQLELMLGQIANFCPVIARNQLTKNSTSLPDIWQKIRQHFGFQSTGGQFLDLADIHLKPEERPEDLFQRISAFMEDNLLTKESNLTHHGDMLDTDEDITPALENIIVVWWLQLLNPALPKLVKQRYGTELRNQTLASIKPEISQALPSLLEELQSQEDAKAMRSFTAPNPSRNNKQFSNVSKYVSKRPGKSCVLCKTAGRPHTHWLSECTFLPDSDRRALARARLTQDIDLCASDTDEPAICDAPNDMNESHNNPLLDNIQSARRVNVIQSPYMDVHYRQHPVRLTLDSGATTNMVRASTATLLGFPIVPASQVAHQADGFTPLVVSGEVHIQVQRAQATFKLDALVVKNLDVDILAGTPFMDTNDIAIRPAKRQIVINGRDITHYGLNHDKSPSTARRTQAYVLRGPKTKTVLLPGEYVDLETPKDTEPDAMWALEPRYDAPSMLGVKYSQTWPSPQEIRSVDHTIRLANNTTSTVTIPRHEHFCQVRSVTPVNSSDCPESTYTPVVRPSAQNKLPYSSAVSLDPDHSLSDDMRQKFTELHRTYDHVFNPTITKYNGACGKIEGTVNMGPVLPPQRKGRLPHYNRDKLVTLQEKFDELESAGVFAKPEQVNVCVEYLNLSFLVQKPNGGSRLVTAFGEVGQYSKPQPSLMPNIDSTLRAIAGWKYLIKSDLLKSFYQIPLSHASMKYCGVATPFKGIRVYTRCAMGMPGSETALEELMSRILGDFIQEGFVAKIADDLYCGGNTPEQALNNWSRVLEVLSKCDIRLSAPKTVICPKKTVILGWTWSLGTLHASPHKISALAAVEPPKTVRSLRAFLGAYKVLSRVLKGYATLLQPLESLAAGKQSQDAVIWSDDMLRHFHTAQKALNDNRTLTLPQPHDEIWIVTDGAVKAGGLGATMYVKRNNSLLLSGFYSTKLRKHQITWLPCEIEALCIGAAISHFAPYIIQASNTSYLLTDSRPCVLAYNKLLRGEFSTSARITTFLSIVSRYQIQLSHISAAANLLSDYASRHPVECPDNSCQVCQFVADLESSVVREVSIQDVCDGRVTLPFTNRSAWHSTQLECPDLRRAHAHLQQGTRPSKKMTNIPDVKRYLQSVIIASDGLLVVRQNTLLRRPRDRIVVPRSVIYGLLTALHMRFNHPSAHQLKRLVSGYFFALDLDQAVQSVTTSCHHCVSLKTIPKHLETQTTATPPSYVGISYAMDIMKRNRQLVLVMRETVTSYTLTKFVDSERHTDLRDAIIILCAEVRCLGDSGIHIRVDPAPGFCALKNDQTLIKYGIQLDIGHVKNINKNPVAERAIEELGLELLHINPEGGPVSHLTLAVATASINARIRRDGLSARELWTQRDQITGDQLPVDDRQVICCQFQSRKSNHLPSARSKASRHTPALTPDLQVGTLVYLKSDKDKCHAREKYMVVSVADSMCQLRKFTKSQFRSKTYDVRKSDCYPITATVPDTRPHGPNRGHGPHSDSDSDSELELVSPPGGIINAPQTLIEPANAPLGAPMPTRKSARSNKGKPPAWLSSADWEI